MEVDELHDPLTLNIHCQTRIFLSKISSDDTTARSISGSTSISQLLENLSRTLAVPAYTTHIATLFRPILLDLCARWASNPIDIEQELVALCLLIEVHEELFPILFRLLQNPAFVRGPVQLLLDDQHQDSKRFHRILLAYYRILQANRQLPYLLYWPLAPLYCIASDTSVDNATRLLAIRCYALQSGMGEAGREQWEKTTFGELYSVDCALEFGDALDTSQIIIDGWLLPVTELERVRTARNALVTEFHDFYSHEGEIPQTIGPSDLCPLVVNLHGILALRSSVADSVSSSIVPTSSAILALRSLTLHLTNRLPILLTSPPSSGKTMLLTHLAETLFPNVKSQLVFIHLADTSLDPRSLLGSHVSSKTRPGTFEWKEGILVQAMKEGRWVVFKDIDRGSNEVLALIKPLIESLGLGKWIGGRASLEVPGRGNVVAADSFAIFATRSILPSNSGTIPPSNFYGAHKLHELIVTFPSVDELELIIKSRYTQLTDQAATGLIHLWEAVRQLGNTASTRDIGLRELEKFCIRTEQLLSYHQPGINSPKLYERPKLSDVFSNTSLREEIFLAARDVFFGSGTMTAAARAQMEAIARVAGTHLALEPERQEWLLTRWTPGYNVETDQDGRTTATRLGRTRLLAKKTKREITAAPSRPFAMHRPAVLLMSRIADAIALCEPVLLTGETGTGKTSAITHLAHTLQQPLISLNLSNQTESSDLIGGFRPLDARVPGLALQSRFLDLFGESFSKKKNEKFEAAVRKSVTQGKWKKAVGLWKESVKLAKDRILKQGDEAAEELDSQTPRKRRKVDAYSLHASRVKWTNFERDLEEFNVQYVNGKGRLAFGFVEGPLIQALREGKWVLLDEINLASPETLECISSILRGPTASVTLTEQGSLEPVPRHPNFRIFACMNPATDVGKKDLPSNIRSRFTEIDVPPPDADRETLLSIITQYIGPSAVSDKAAIMNVAEFYTSVKELAETRQISDGSNHRPYYSMRTITRALTFASDIAGTYGLRRAIWEGCLMAFTMVLDASSAAIVTAVAQKYLLAGVKNIRSLLAKEPSLSTPENTVKLGPFYLERGPLLPDSVEEYILTPSVETKLIDLARIILTRRFPVLIEGPTSSGKTSSVEYLAKRTGHRFIRINNHEHTDIQEYLGSYAPHPTTGKLVFTDGLLVQALRNGDWVVLDELNLAPTDVLEALNRLLDDNRELVIPETGEVVRPHPNFMLFATQNPPGLYAGRKVLSRAFRNRFLEVHFDDVPEAELETILCRRCAVAPSYGKKIVMVFRELQKRRQSDRVFDSRHGFATLRDLFRWAGRDAVGYQELAENGYMLLAERARKNDDKATVKEVIELIMGVRIDEDRLYDFQNRGNNFGQFLGCDVPSDSSLIWTKAMRRLFILLTRALRFNEPVLLVGETGSGKTSVCQMFAEVTSRVLRSLNCHQNTETADLIGGLRPVRNKVAFEREILQRAAALSSEIGIDLDTGNIEALELHLEMLFNSGTLSSAVRGMFEEVHRRIIKTKAIFEWHDGPLVEAMRDGDVFLLDEISLADDSVLERLNSVLEPSRTLVLAEKVADIRRDSSIVAHNSFKLVATMNPGGDYGKKELSPALRNRFTEIWVPSVDDLSDLNLIVDCRWEHEVLRRYTPALLEFVDWLSRKSEDVSLLNLRDILAWVSFSNAMYTLGMPTEDIFHHAAHMTYLDGLASIPSLVSMTGTSLEELRLAANARLDDLVPRQHPTTMPSILDSPSTFQLGYFSIAKGSRKLEPNFFNFQAPTTQINAMRVIRASQLSKPILLEGSPGVGKTSLITALAKITGHELCRINLSDQTDLIELFGSDLPTNNGKAGEFAWRDGEFLRALQEGKWVLLDEMNLAPQAVLEGLNAVLDHRGSIFIPELGRTFAKHPEFRIFAAQNPLSQGGGRKGLPKSFVNRFTRVFVDQLSASDLLLVCQYLHPDVDSEILRPMIEFNSSLNNLVSVQHTEGAPWEFNLRDVLRWIDAMKHPSGLAHPGHHIRNVYFHRFRNLADRNLARSLFEQTFKCAFDHTSNPTWTISSSDITIGQFNYSRRNFSSSMRSPRLLQSQLSALEATGCSISHSLLAILIGTRNSGKTALVRILAGVTGRILLEVPINSATDAMDLLGSFEQINPQIRARDIALDVISLIEGRLRVHPELNINTPAYISLRRSACEAVSWDTDTVTKAVSALCDGLSDTVLATQILSLSTKMKECLLSAQNDTAGRFEWVDGPLVRAMKAGHWLLLDGANLCNPSILDRLNSLCEANGSLALSERGFVNGEIQILKPHPDFRLFMTVDPQYGELSRAMRNRGVEISLISSLSADDKDILLDHYRLPIPMEHYASIPLSKFTATRLGIQYQRTQVSTSKLPSGLVLEDAMSCHVLDISTVLVDSSVLNDEEATYHFLSRSVVPSAIPLLLRLVQSQSNDSDPKIETVKRILHTGVETLDELRDRYAATNMFRSRHMLGMPVDFFLVVQPLTLGSDHQLVLNMLRLVVAMHLNGPPPKNSDSHFTFSKDPRVQDIRANIAALQKEAHITSALMLKAVSSTESVNVPDSDVLTSFFEILNCTRSLRDIASRDVLDYSAFRALAEQLISAFQKLSIPLASMQDHIADLKQSITLSSGLGLNQIWSAFYDNSLAVTDAQRLDELVAKIEGPSELKRQVLHLMAIVYITRSSGEISLTEIIKELKRHIRPDNTPLEEKDVLKESHLASRLSLLVSGLSSRRLSDSARNAITNLINTGCARPFGRLDSLITYQQSLWLDDTIQDVSSSSNAEAHNTSTMKTALFAAWMNDLWANKDDVNAALFRPAQLCSVLSIWDWSSTPLAKLSQYEADLRSHAQLALLNTEQALSRTEQLVIILKHSILKIASCFTSTENDLDQSNALTMFGSKVNSLTIPELGDALNHLAFKQAVESRLLPAFSCSDHTNEPHPDIARLGLCWIAVGQLLFDLFLPNTPIDPAAIQSHTYTFWTQRIASLSKELALHSENERLLTGNTENSVLEYLRKSLSNVQDHLVDGPPRTPHREISKLQMFWSEALLFRNQVLDPAKLDALAGLLQAGDSSANDREDVVQSTIQGFVQRLQTGYQEFDDIIFPIRYASLHFQMGLRILRLPSSFKSSAYSITAAIIAFPAIRSAAALITEQVKAIPSDLRLFQQLLLTMAAMTMEAAAGINFKSHLLLLEAVYEQVLRLWHIDRKKEEEEQSASESLYRQSRVNHNMENDEEIEAREFAELFPSFESALVDDASSSDRPFPSPTCYVPDFRQFLHLHNAFFSGETLPATWYRSIRLSVLPSLLPSVQVADRLDYDALPLSLSLIADRFVEMHDAAGAQTTVYNFYSDPNIQQTRKAALVVANMKGRLALLIQEWPDQMVLRHLEDRCDTVLALDLRSPVAKVLSALEQLLLRSEDWEAFANKDNSLRANRSEMVELIVSWRRMELSSWQVLLEAEARKFEDAVSPWWFRLYDLIIRGPLDVLQRESGGLSSYLDSLVPLLDDFIRQSPLGQFRTRLKLLRSFGELCRKMSQVHPGERSEVLTRTYRIVHSTVSYYMTFSDAATSDLSSQRSRLETDVRNLVKLASWKDVNVYALRQSAQRTHRQLYKHIRKFRDVLRTPVSESIETSPSELPDFEEASNVDAQLDFAYPSTPSFPNITSFAQVGAPSHLIHLDRTYSRFEELVSGQIVPFLSFKSPHVVESLAFDIIGSSKQLSSISISTSLPAERRHKQQKALLTRKRKAWSDLLKELKKAGFAAHLKPEISDQNQSIRWIREQPTPGEPSAIPWDFQKSEMYWNRLNALMPLLRGKISSHHEDILTRDLQRGVSFLESSFHMAAESRTRHVRIFYLLANTCRAYAQLKRDLGRIRELVSSGGTFFSGNVILNQITPIFSMLCRIESTLVELQSTPNTFIQLDPASPLIFSVTDSIKNLLTSCIDIRNRFKDLMSNVQLTSFIVLLAGEYELVLESLQFVKQAVQTLRSCVDEEARLGPYLNSTLDWLQSYHLEFSPPKTVNDSAASKGDEIINTCLAGVEALIAKTSGSFSTEDDDRDNYIRTDYQDVRDTTSLFKIDRILELLTDSSQGLALSSVPNIQRYLPFLQRYSGLVQIQLILHARWTKSLLKLSFILCSVLNTLCQQGFCKPPDTDEEGASEDGMADISDGVGLGEGSGAKDASKDIQEESQVEGLQGEETSTNPQDEKDADAIEMSQDFGAEMEDVLDDDESQDEDSDEGSHMDTEERIADLDASDPAAVDEKFWGDEKDPQDDSDGQANQKNSTQQSRGSETVAKESADKKLEPDKNDSTQSQEDPTSSQPDPEDVSQAEENASDPNASGAPIDENVPETDTLELPDDIKMDGEDAPDEMDIDAEQVDEEYGAEAPPDLIDEQEQSRNNLEASPTEQPDSQDINNAEGDPMPADGADNEDNVENPAVAPPDVSQGQGESTTEQALAEKNEEPSPNQSSTSMGPDGGAATESKLAKDQHGSGNVDPPQAHELDVGPSMDVDSPAGAIPIGSELGPQPSLSNEQLSNNPLRSIADALKEVQRRFDAILDNPGFDLHREQLGELERPTTVEYLRPEDTDYDMQALGPAQDERVAKLQELNLTDDNLESSDGIPSTPAVDQTMTFEGQGETSRSEPAQLEPQGSVGALDADNTIFQSVAPISRDEATAKHDGLDADVDIAEVEEPGVEAEVELRRWQAAGLPESQATNIWRLYESLTHELAYALCEQLRLILEPTLATRLQGDYRTGKRLNMKKIIPFIASDYTKDKIWLRRTRPSQREYQILIALDDSRSMAESHSVHLAYQTLALVSKALTRLEAGEIGIARFGQDVQILHGFDGAPFNDQAGIEVIKAFHFDQNATNVLSLVDTSLKVLEAARERRSMSSTTAADIWQLEIIISDGICQDHDKLRAALRLAEERRVMIVFIILDSLHSGGATKPGSSAQGSILSMEKAEFKNVEGKMELQLQRYLDSFPFDYHLVLRDLETLPSVLSATLRQFFERISGE
ncbi:hypothetical protein D9757_007075 [Collybiopsis confluens]|uniref:Midasin n=1 Tax=Collybiopsis confluens TaxID=2823264 RepID=A0A8H5HC91_9AGAR|nr:hypothetical protein D9757_007075 [Collybiopsis confluens]